VEYKDASAGQRAVDLCNSGVMAFDGALLPQVLAKIGNDNAKGEYYLTDAVAIARTLGRVALVVEADADALVGVNDRADLAHVEHLFQQRTRSRMMTAGVTLTAPETVFFSHDTVLERDVLVEPHVVFGSGVHVAQGARIRAFSHLEGADVATGAVVGPYARLRPGAVIGKNAKVGNFVEIKKATLEDGAKASHLSYIGDAHVGAGANIGAGTITCNYDGFLKYRTEIGAGAFIGSNTALVAPLSIGSGAIIGAGSTITGNVEPDALSLARPPQQHKDDWAQRFRDNRLKQKAARKAARAESPEKAGSSDGAGSSDRKRD
jgi:bifunctional UDP-N-acetylglucosamine pyrophosphorylase/glucosamine-1-phosphate N-acetyltransferase